MGNFVTVYNDSRIEGVCRYNGVVFNPMIVLEDGVCIQQEFHLTCAKSVFVGRNTAIAAHVTITDIHHPYTDVSVPIEKQNIVTKPVRIGMDCKIYNGVVILPGVTIGNHVTIGANSVVNHDIPDFSVAVGSPAKIIKKFNFKSQSWEKH